MIDTTVNRQQEGTDQVEDKTLIVDDLHVSVEGREILKGINLEVKAGEIHALMGPNGSGKSTLAYTIAGHPKYEVTQGRVIWKGQNILELEADQRAKLGVFLAFQYPTAIPGVTMVNFLRLAVKNVVGEMPAIQFRRLVKEKMAMLKMDDSFATRYLNEGFSGGEKKRAEILQMALLRPELAVMDETDSGLDIDALRIVADGINLIKQQDRPDMGVLMITHYQRLLNYIKPDFVHVLVDGQIVRSGGSELAEELEAKGYEWLLKALGKGASNGN
jgi:Fe-S cluster assembly ATP-binding protein